MDTSTGLKTYTNKERNMYLTGLLGQNILYNVTNVLLVSYFLQNVLYIPAIVVSVIIAIARVWDAFNDPIMGTIVDKTRSKWGKCRPYLLYLPLPIMIISILCFVNFEFDPSMSIFEGRNAFVILWAGFTYILWGMLYTAGDIPLWGVTALMTEDEKHKEKLLSLARMAAGVGGGVAVLGLQPFALAMSDKFGSERTGFFVAGLVATIIGSVLFQFAGIGVKEKIRPSEKKNSIKENFKLMWTNKPFRQILLSGLLNAPQQLMMTVAFTLVTYYYSGKDPLETLLYIALLGGGLFVGQFVAMALVPKILDKISKKKLYNGSKIISVVPQLLIFVLFLLFPDKLTNPILLIVSMLLFTVCGVSMGIVSVLQSLMISDAVDYEEYHSGLRPDGVFFSGQTFLVKISSGLATIIYGAACTYVGFTDKNIKLLDEFIAAGGVFRDSLLSNEQYFGFAAMLFFCMSVPPAIGALLSVIPTWKYCLDDDEHSRILKELQKRRREKEEAQK